MAEEIFSVLNVKCGGCANTIKEALNKLDAVQDTDVVIDSGTVTVQGEDLDRARIAETLKQIGYPEA